MEKSKTFTITKDFGSKTLSKVFVKETETSNINISIKERIFEAVKKSQTVCLVTENLVDNELMGVLRSARENTGLRIYAIEPKLSEASFALLQNNCIAREVPEIKGNFLFCDTREAFFYDEKLNGFCLNNSATVEQLHNYFIYQFWNKATKEFVSEIKTVAEKTFDVAPISDSKELVVNQASLLDNAESFCIPQKLPDFAKAKSDNAILYLGKTVIQKNREWLLNKNGSKIICTDSLSVPLCKSNGSWYILNNDFAVLLEEEPVFDNCFFLKDELSYRDAVEKEILALEDFSPVLVKAGSSENKTISVDYKTFKHISHMSENERFELFEKNNLLLSDKIATCVDFSIIMGVRKLSKDAKLAPIYSEYENFQKEFAACVKKLENDISASDTKIKNCNNELNIIKSQIEDLRKQNKDYSQLEKQREGKQKAIDSETKSFEAKKLSLKKAKDLPAAFENLEECKKAFELFDSLKSNLPGFDKPKFGILYKTNTGHEYVLNPQEDLDKAEAEMQIAKISDVKFVDSNQ